MDYTREHSDLIKNIIDAHDDCGEFSERVVGKCILLRNNTIALTANDVHDFNLLPGGGINKEEDLYSGVKRECEEETGFKINIIKSLGTTSDFRKRRCKKYITTCVVAEAAEYVGEKLTNEEADIGFEIIWLEKEKILPLMEEQVKLVQENNVEFYNTKFNIVRDYLFLKNYLAGN